MHKSTPVPPSVDIGPGKLIQIATSLINNVQGAKKRLLDAITTRDATFDNVICALADIENEVKGKVQFLALFQAVSPSPKLRHESSIVVKMVDKAYLELFQDEDVFALVDSVHNSCGDGKLDIEDKKFLDSLHSTFLDNGLGLNEKDKTRFHGISKRLVELRVAFTENLSLHPGYVWKCENELEGLEAGKIQAFPLRPLTGQRGVPLTKSCVNAVLSKCVKPETREEVFIQSQRVFPKNIALFQEIIILRDEGARLLGFKSYAHQQARHKLLKSPESVESMLDELSSYLHPVAKAELEELQSIKPTHGTPFYLWDFDYYHCKMLQDNYLVDHDLISEYFPANITIRRMLNVFGRIFSLKIEGIQSIRDESIWHPDVKVFMVQDIASAAFVGFLYIDIYQREGKYNHAANFNIFPSYSVPKGKSQPIVCTSLVCNVAQPLPGKLALLQHHEVITIFHELGHAFHDLLGRSRYARFHGHRTVSDFIEAPSQLLEYWCWVPDCLQQLSCHYSYVNADDDEECKHPRDISASTPPREIPRSLVERLVEAKGVNQGILTMRQVAFSTFDMQIHCPISHAAVKSMDISNVYNSLLQASTFLKGPEHSLNWGNGYATTPHYIWGQEANYYSYLYTRMLAADIWWSNFHSNPMSQKAGLNYRKTILEPGGSQDERMALAEFLGRESTTEVYLRYLKYVE